MSAAENVASTTCKLGAGRLGEDGGGESETVGDASGKTVGKLVGTVGGGVDGGASVCTTGEVIASTITPSAEPRAVVFEASISTTTPSADSGSGSVTVTASSRFVDANLLREAGPCMSMIVT